MRFIYTMDTMSAGNISMSNYLSFICALSYLILLDLRQLYDLLNPKEAGKLRAETMAGKSMHGRGRPWVFTQFFPCPLLLCLASKPVNPAHRFFSIMLQDNIPKTCSLTSALRKRHEGVLCVFLATGPKENSPGTRHSLVFS